LGWDYTPSFSSGAAACKTLGAFANNGHSVRLEGWS